MTTTFMNALNGSKGELDAWLECNDEKEVREAMQQALRDVLEQAAQLCDRNAQSTSGDEIRAMIKEIPE